MKISFRISRPLRNPEGLADMRQSAKQWIATLIESLGDQLADEGDGSIKLEIGGSVIEFRIIKIPGVLDVRRIQVVQEAQP